MTAKISHFSLRLYAFHLRDTGKQPARDAENIWRQCAEFGANYDIADLRDIFQKLSCYREGEYSLEAEQQFLLEQIRLNPKKSLADINLLEQQNDDKIGQIKFNISLTIASTDPSTEKLDFDCSLYPVLLQDTYCITIEFKSKVALSSQTLDHTLTLLHECIQYFQPSIGRSFLLSLQSTESNYNLEELAKTCSQKLFDTNPINIPSFQLLGNPIISYDLPKRDSKIDADNQASSDRLLVWTINNYSTSFLKSFINISRPIRQLFCFYHKILYIRQTSAKTLDQALEINKNTRRTIQELKSLITNETLVSDLVEQKLELCQESVSTYQEIIAPIQQDFISLEKQGRNYELTLKFLKEKRNFAESDLEILYQLPANFDVNRYRIDDLFDKTQGWFVKNSSESEKWVELHDLDLNLSEQKWNEGLNNFKHKLEYLFGFPLPAAWWSDRQAVQNIHQNLKHLCGDTACSSSVSNFAISKRPITIAGAYLIALIAYVKVFKCTDLENSHLAQNIDWAKCKPYVLMAVQDSQTARASAKALYDFFCAVFGRDAKIESALFDRDGARLRIQIWNAKGLFSKFSELGLQIPDTAANTSQAILQLWRFMLPSEDGFLSPAAIYMKDDCLILSSAEF